ncbi:hypothetical protein [Streptomyces europaeiscabiei]|uniref:hypothetical protein n=1 Tax=Streptomyces europaeiscabiei TaxID=146819 RepID=UPI0039A51E1D
MRHKGASYFSGRLLISSWRSSSRREPLRFSASVMRRNGVWVIPRLRASAELVELGQYGLGVELPR